MNRRTMLPTSPAHVVADLRASIASARRLALAGLDDDTALQAAIIGHLDDARMAADTLAPVARDHRRAARSDVDEIELRAT